MLNHAAVATVTEFMAAAAQAGVTIPVIASVAIFTDAPSAAVLSGLPGLELDPAVVRGVLEDPDPVARRHRRRGAGGRGAAGHSRRRGREHLRVWPPPADMSSPRRSKPSWRSVSGNIARMARNVGDPMAAEFGTVAEWTAQVAADLGPEYFIPAACRGSGQPAALDWLLAGLRPRPGDLMVDAGAGAGGPAAYATGRTGVRPVLVEPEHGACRAAATLFHAPVVEADATALPLRGRLGRPGLVPRCALHR